MLSALRLVLALSVFAAIGYQFSIHVELGFSAINFFSYFTNLSNLFAACVLTAEAIRSYRGIAPASHFVRLRFIAVVNMAIVGIVFSLLLRNADLGSLRPWINTLLHYVMPVFVVLDWIIDPPREQLQSGLLLLLELAPASYLAYVLIRGSRTGWYPYPFLNPATVGGYGAVAMYAAGIALTFLVVGWAVLRLQGRRISA